MFSRVIVPCALFALSKSYDYEMNDNDYATYVAGYEAQEDYEQNDGYYQEYAEDKYAMDTQTNYYENEEQDYDYAYNYDQEYTQDEDDDALSKVVRVYANQHIWPPCTRAEYRGSLGRKRNWGECLNAARARTGINYAVWNHGYDKACHICLLKRTTYRWRRQPSHSVILGSGRVVTGGGGSCVRVPSQKTCTGSGDPHVVTFDGSYYHPQGKFGGNRRPRAGWFHYVTNCAGQRPLGFDIQFYWQPYNTIVAGTRGMKIIGGGLTFQVMYRGATTLNGNTVRLTTNKQIYLAGTAKQASSIPCKGGAAVGYMSGRHIVIEVYNNGVQLARVTYDNAFWGYSRVYLSKDFAGKACGICGKMSTVATDDFELCNGQQIPGIQQGPMRHFRNAVGEKYAEEFAESWRVGHRCARVEKPPTNPKPPVKCTDGQKRNAINLCDRAFNAQCRRLCPRKVGNAKKVIVDECADDMMAMDGCRGNARGKAISELFAFCRRGCK